MRFLPSTAASVVTGALILPVYLLGIKPLTRAFEDAPVLDSIVQIVWTLLMFFAPILFSTVDVGQLVRQFRASGGFLASCGDLRTEDTPLYQAEMRFLYILGSGLLSAMVIVAVAG